MSKSLRVNNLSKSFGNTIAVSDVTLEVEEGEFFTLLGPSGCGKTTTLRCIAGLETPTSGEIYIGDEDVRREPIHKRGIGMVFQDYALFPHMKVRKNVAFGLKMQGKKDNLEERVDRALRMVQLEEEKDSPIDQLSGGQQQRVALARAIVIEPTILLSDEPLGALDLKLRQELQVELKNLIDELGITTLHVTHDQQEALTMSDRVAVMNDGEIVQVGTPRELYENPKNEFISNFIGKSNVLQTNLVKKNGTKAVLELSGEQMTIEYDDGLLNHDQPFVTVRPENIQITTSEIDDVDVSFEGTLDDIVYLGERTLYSVNSETEDDILVSKQGAQQIDEGQTVQFGWNANEAVILEEQDT